jgi:hypothetical protein
MVSASDLARIGATLYRGVQYKGRSAWQSWLADGLSDLLGVFEKVSDHSKHSVRLARYYGAAFAERTSAKVGSRWRTRRSLPCLIWRSGMPKCRLRPTGYG